MEGQKKGSSPSAKIVMCHRGITKRFHPAAVKVQQGKLAIDAMRSPDHIVKQIVKWVPHPPAKRFSAIVAAMNLVGIALSFAKNAIVVIAE